MTIPKRLRQALSFADRGIRHFQRELELRFKKKGISGSSYAQVHNYLNGKREPSLSVLREAAAVLKVREPWLVLGEGEPTVTEEALEHARTAEAVYQQIYDWVPELLDSPPSHPDAFHDALRKWVIGASDSEDLEMEVKVLGPMARGLYNLLNAPLECWGFRSMLPEELETEYFLAMLTALRIAMAPRASGDPIGSFPKVSPTDLPVRASPRNGILDRQSRRRTTPSPTPREQ